MFVATDFEVGRKSTLVACAVFLVLGLTFGHMDMVGFRQSVIYNV